MLSDGILRCEIVDDGIGRIKAAAIKAKAKTKHQSTGIRVTQKRLEQLAVQTGVAAGFVITDLINEDKEGIGTRVVITIPVDV